MSAAEKELQQNLGAKRLEPATFLRNLTLAHLIKFKLDGAEKI